MFDKACNCFYTCYPIIKSSSVTESSSSITIEESFAMLLKPLHPSILLFFLARVLDLSWVCLPAPFLLWTLPVLPLRHWFSSLTHFTHLSESTIKEAYTSQYNTHLALLIMKRYHNKWHLYLYYIPFLECGPVRKHLLSISVMWW